MSTRIFIGILITAVLAFGFSCRSKTVVKKLVNQDASISNKSETKKIDGVMYHLPKTLVQVTVPVNKVTKTPGEFMEFAPCFFSESERKGMIVKPSQSFSINPPSFSSRGVADTSETYVIKTKGKYFESKSLFVEYAPGYVLQKGEAESKDETLEFTVKAIATAASIASKIVPLALSTNDTERKEQLQALRKEYNCLDSIKSNVLNELKKVLKEKEETLKQKEVLTGTASNAPELKEEIESLKQQVTQLNDEKEFVEISTAKTLDDIKQIQKQESPQPDAIENPNKFRNKYQTALALYNRLQELIIQRDGALTGGGQNIPPDTYKQYLERNAEAIAAHRAAFLGLTSKETWAATFEFDPDKDDHIYTKDDKHKYSDYSELLFSYSKTKGVCNNGQLKEKSIPINPAFKFTDEAFKETDQNKEPCGDTTESKVQALWLKVVKSDDQIYLNNVKVANDRAAEEDKSRGWFYRVPANGVVSLQTQELDCQQRKGEGAKKSCLINSFTIAKTPGDGEIIAKYDGIVNEKEEKIPVKSNQIARNEMLIAQLGVVASVPASTSGRSSITAIMLDPATGAMKNYKSSSLPLVDKAILDDAQKAANSAIDAIDPLNRKKRELEELKTQNQINEEKKKLANTNTGNTENDNDQ
jgi:hypothetical protein